MLAAGVARLARAPWPRYRPRDDPLPAHDAVNLGAAAIAAGTVVIGLVAAWVWPPLAMATVWPMFVVVPGWALVGWAVRGRARISSTGRAGLAVVLSVAVSAHLVWWLATLVGGYGREVVFAVAAILAVPIPLVVARMSSPPSTRMRATWRMALRAVRRRPAAFGVAAGASLVVGVVLARGLWQVNAGGVDVGGANWSDLGVHLSIAQSVNAGNFPPQVPFFAGEPLVYHWFADFHAAILAEAAGLFAIPVFIVQSALLAGALALLVHGLSLALVRTRWAGRTALLATLLVVLGGGMGWIRLVGDLAAGRGHLWDLLMVSTYDNAWLTDWPYFSIPSVLTTGLLVHRATTIGLPLLVGAVLLAAAGIPTARQVAVGFVDRPRLILLSGVAGALLAPFHFFFFPIVPLLVLAWVVVGGRLLERRTLRSAAIFAAPYVLAVPFAAPAFDQATGSGWLSLVLGWQTAPWDEGPLSVLFFYATNLGLPFALALVALLLPRTPSRAFLAGWVVLLFLIPNLVQVSYVSFDMNKYFQAMWIAVAVLAGGLLARWPVPVAAVVLVVCMTSPLLAAVHTAFSRNYLMSADQLAAAAWIAEHTPERSVFVTDDWIIAPTDPAGRLRLTTFGPYVANLGYDPGAREHDIDRIRCGGNVEEAADLMRRLGADYVLPAGAGCEAPVDFAASPLFERVYANATVTIYRLRDA
jgi:hypothetical protein